MNLTNFESNSFENLVLAFVFALALVLVLIVVSVGVIAAVNYVDVVIAAADVVNFIVVALP